MKITTWFYVIGFENVIILKTFPLTVINTYYFHENNKNNILATYRWYKSNTL